MVPVSFSALSVPRPQGPAQGNSGPILLMAQSPGPGAAEMKQTHTYFGLKEPSGVG